MPPTLQEWAKGLTDRTLASYLRGDLNQWTVTEQEALLDEAARRLEAADTFKTGKS